MLSTESVLSTSDSTAPDGLTSSAHRAPSYVAPDDATPADQRPPSRQSLWRPLRTERHTRQYIAAYRPYLRISWPHPAHGPSSHIGHPSAAEAAARSTGVIRIGSREPCTGMRGRVKPPVGWPRSRRGRASLTNQPSSPALQVRSISCSAKVITSSSSLPEAEGRGVRSPT